MKSKVADVVLSKLDEFDVDIPVYPSLKEALVGYMLIDRKNTGQLVPAAVYSFDLAVQATVDSSESTGDRQTDWEEAEEWILYNCADAYLGPSTPVFLTTTQFVPQVDEYPVEKED